ncbi:hypothetical protein AB0F52_38545 [Amycolatopsis sp. NPDC024027]|uniref:hypothetical protein n=1 Tax=Amycolatopsis sp. NPDC024027 TaxID=3154327 RepID=UPI0033D1EAC4
MKPLVDSGAAVQVQFSDPNSPRGRLARRWENEGNARRPERLALFRHHHDPVGEADTLDSLGFIAHRTGDHQQALDHY